MDITKEKRDYYLDTIKGVLVASIVFIHTVFWSGENYVPNYMRNIALFFDVPLFFFATGCVLSIHSKFNPLKQMYKLIFIYFFTTLIYQICFLDFNFLELIKTLCFNMPNIPNLPVVAGSYWFIPIYIISMLYSKIIIESFKKWVTYLTLIAIPLYYVILWFSKEAEQITIFGKNIQLVLFYTWLMLIGYQFFKYKNKKFWLCLSIIIAISTIAIFYYIPDLSLQSCKFPVKLPYFIISLLSISLTMFFYKKLKDNIFAEIGKNALYYYISQGIGASIIIPVAKLSINIWPIKLLLCFSINLFATIAFGYIISLIYPKLENLFINTPSKI